MTQNNLGNAYLRLPTGDRGENLRAAIECYERALRAAPGYLQWRPDGDGSWLLEFFLPAGSYATALLRELIEVD